MDDGSREPSAAGGRADALKDSSRAATENSSPSPGPSVAPATGQRDGGDTGATLNIAREYLRHEWSVIPLRPRDKRPALDSWERWQRERPDEEMVRRWWTDDPTRNIGIPTGAVSGLVVLDVDGEKGEESLRGLEVPRTPTVLTGKGRHLYFAHAGREVPNAAGLRPGLDVRGDGGYVVAPPSIHPSGTPYRWASGLSPEEVALAPCPAWLLERSQDRKPAEPLPDKISEGQRNAALTSLAGSMRRRGAGEPAILAALRVENAARCDPPLPEEEVRRIAESVARYPSGHPSAMVPKTEPEAKREKEEKKEKAAERVAQAGREVANVLFNDGHGTAYAFVRVGGHRECHQIRSRAFERLVVRTYYENFTDVPSREALTSGLALLEAMGLFDGNSQEVHNRVARGPDGALYYDLSDSEWRAVKVTPEGWEVVREPPVAFRRYSHQAPQVEPVRGGSLSDLLNFLNVSGDDDRLIISAKVPTDLLPDIPHPIANANGSQGAAKSTGQKMLRRVVDPSITPVLTLPRDSVEMLQLLDHHYAPIFDNTRNLQPWQSDAMCRASTGDGSSKRELYSDDNDIIRRYRRVIFINGINVAAEAPDYLDRSILHAFERIPKANRRPEAAIWREFEAALPRILGAVFDALAGAARLYPAVEAEVKELPRMADFAIWGEAASRAMGNRPGEFLAAYGRSIEARNREAIEASPVGAAVLRLLAVGTEEAPGEMDRWEGTAGDLLRALKVHAEAIGVDLRGRSWPRSPKSLGRRLREVRSNLAEEGVRVEFVKDSSGARVITIARPRTSGENAVNAETPESLSGAHGVSTAFHGKREIANAVEKSASGDGLRQDGVSGVSAGTSTPPSKCPPCGRTGYLIPGPQGYPVCRDCAGVPKP